MSWFHVYLGSHCDSDNDDNQNENNQSNGTVQFLRLLSSHVEDTRNEQTIQRMSSISNNSARDLAIADGATQLLLTRLGIMRRMFWFYTDKIIFTLV